MRPHEAIPNTYRDVSWERLPAGITVGNATLAEPRVAGFYGGPQGMTLMSEARPVLRDTGGRIVATWDEGRWWTPDELDAFLRTLTLADGEGERSRGRYFPGLEDHSETRRENDHEEKDDTDALGPE